MVNFILTSLLLFLAVCLIIMMLIIVDNMAEINIFRDYIAPKIRAKLDKKFGAKNEQE